MEFEEWWETYESNHMADMVSAEDAWDAATKAERERCANLAKMMTDNCCRAGYVCAENDGDPCFEKDTGYCIERAIRRDL